MNAPSEDRPALDRWLERVFDDDESSRLGSGWLSGTVSVFLGALGLLAVLVLWFPEWLSTARFRALYPLPLVRGLVQGVIATGFVTGCISLLLRQRKVLGLTGCGLSVLAALLGGGGVALPDSLQTRPTLGLDWFVLNLFLLALLFVPLLAAILLADLAQYGVHRAFHRVPLLWRFHAVHHSSRDMDWLAGSRLHVVDAVVTRGLVLVPLHLAGFAEPALYGYLAFVSFHGNPVPEGYLGQLTHPFRLEPTAP